MSGSSYRLTKRILDIIGALAGMGLFSLLYLIIGPAIKLDSHGPVLIALSRVSGGRTIRLYKFRSMKVGAEHEKKSLAHLNERADGPFFKIKKDPRVTTVGRIIRATRLDEVPQFINVLKGELSLVGPRPHEPEEVAAYPTAYAFLSLEKGGITGLSQVSGASKLPFRKELELDSYYVQNQTLGLDLKIIAKTISIVLFDPTAV